MAKRSSPLLKSGLLLLFLLSMPTFFSCNKSDDDNNQPVTTYDKLKGKWTVVSLNEKKYEDNNLIKDETSTFSSGEYTIEFKEKEVTISYPGATMTYPIDYNKDLNEFEYDDSGIKIKSTVTFNAANNEATFVSTEEHLEDGVQRKEVVTAQLKKL